jgi:hypothetical protein
MTALASKVYVGDVGTVVMLNCGADISGATTSIQVRKPDGSDVVWDSTVYNTNYVKHTITSGELDIPGKYLMQARVELVAWQGLGATAVLAVYAEYE